MLIKWTYKCQTQIRSAGYLTWIFLNVHLLLLRSPPEKKQLYSSDLRSTVGFGGPGGGFGGPGGVFLVPVAVVFIRAPVRLLRDVGLDWVQTDRFQRDRVLHNNSNSGLPLFLLLFWTLSVWTQSSPTSLNYRTGTLITSTGVVVVVLEHEL